MAGLACWLFATLTPGTADAEEAAPYQRIVSINLAADELVLQLADPDHIVALSRLSADPELSRLADRAGQFPITDGSAEHVLRLRPDIVFAGQYTRQVTVDLLERVDIEVVRLPVGRDLEQSRNILRKVAKILDVEERGERLLAEMDQRMKSLQEKVAQRETRPTALVYGQGGFTQGGDTLIHHILEAAGFDNHALSFGISGQANMPLEKLLLSPPDFLVLLPYYRNDPTLGAMLLQHRALRQFPDRMHLIDVPLGWTLTGNNLTIRSAEHLWEQAEDALRETRKETL